MEFEENFFEEEIRSDHLVSKKMKRIWAVEMEMLDWFDRFCRRNCLRYWVGYGTMLGAARHKGFIPWDDDIDVIMPRPDYERMKKCIQDELPEYYFFQNSYTENIVIAFSKIRDSRTTAYEKSWGKSMHMGIFIDIFPLDGAYMETGSNISQIELELWMSIVRPDMMYQHMVDKDVVLNLPDDMLKEILVLDVKDKMNIFEDFCASHYEEAVYINDVNYELFGRSQTKCKKEWFEETIYLPFENMSVPMPKGYDLVLQTLYGDWHQIVKGGTAHEGIIIEPDIPYKEFFKQLEENGEE